MMHAPASVAQGPAASSWQMDGSPYGKNHAQPAPDSHLYPTSASTTGHRAHLCHLNPKDISEL